MVITLINCIPKLLAKGINMQNGDNDKLTSQLQGIVSLTGWDYSFEQDVLRVDVPDGTVIPNGMSDYGDVVTNDNPMG